MADVPAEFRAEHVAANSPLEEQIYTEKLRTPYPGKSFQEQGYAFKPSPNGDENGVDLSDGTLYYNTQDSATAAYWEEHGPLPRPTKDIHQMRKDFKAFGYCMVQDAFNAEQLKEVRTRVVEQAEGERMAGVAFWYSGGAGSGHTTHATQFVPTLVNKGDVFAKIICHEPEAIQGGPVIEQILSETVGPGWCVTSFLSIIAGKGGHPQNLHQVGLARSQVSCSPT